MERKSFTDEQIAYELRQAEAGTPRPRYLALVLTNAVNAEGR